MSQPAPRAAVLRFPGTNCERETARALEQVGLRVEVIDAGAARPLDHDVVVLPGGFSWGDYLRCGAMAARAPIMPEVRAAAARGQAIIGICNGFQVLCEAGLLPGALMKNASGRFSCRSVTCVLDATAMSTPLTCDLEVPGRTVDPVEPASQPPTSDLRAPHPSGLELPIAHAEGRYVASAETLDELEASGRVILRYAAGSEVNGSARGIAGVASAAGNVVGLMPHPERAAALTRGHGSDGLMLLRCLASWAVRRHVDPVGAPDPATTPERELVHAP